jgi:hypothetical protein
VAQQEATGEPTCFRPVNREFSTRHGKAPATPDASFHRAKARLRPRRMKPRLTERFAFSASCSGFCSNSVLAAGSVIGRFEVDRQSKVASQPQGHRGKNQPKPQAFLPDIKV